MRKKASEEKQNIRGNPQSPLTLAIDIGGTGIKAVKVDSTDQPASEFMRVLTPWPATPSAVLKVIDRFAQELAPFDRVSVGFPGVIKTGVVWTAVNLHLKWIGFDLAEELSSRLGKPARVANDAAVQGLGTINGEGVELMITLGTGVGSSLFIDGTLVPGLEMGHHPFRNEKTYEEQLGKKALDRVGLRRWNRRLKLAIDRWASLFNYDQLYIGGGNAKRVSLKLPENAKIVANKSGLIGGPGLWRQKQR